MNAVFRFLMVLCLAISFANSAHAHSRSQSASDWEINGNRLNVVFSIDSRRATLLYGLAEMDGVSLAEALSLHLVNNMYVELQGAVCTLDGPPQALNSSEGYERQGFSFQCPDDVEGTLVTITMDTFFEVSSTHLHIIRVQSNNELLIERVLTGGTNRVTLGPEPSGTSQLASFIRTGFGHVLSGWDHLAFLAALLLLAGSLRPMILTITGFTLGHSLTMGLVAFGLLSPHAMAIEVLIGFSIAYAAIEAGAKDAPQRDRLILWTIIAVAGVMIALAARGYGTPWPPVLALTGICLFVFTQGPQPGGHRLLRAPLLAAMFGLAHGAGFAGALLDFDLQGAGAMWTLLGFNIGVEIGQLAAVSFMFFSIYLLKSITRFETEVLAMPNAMILFGLGIFWTVSRLIL